VPFADRILTCAECGAEFVFTAGEQAFFHDKQFKNDPKHCKQCRAKRSPKRPGAVTETRVTCPECGTETTVPFKPRLGKPVLCHACFLKSKRGPVPPEVLPGASDPPQSSD
jgi:CxxC-x17-CxxC domain-containing protein